MYLHTLLSNMGVLEGLWFVAFKWHCYIASVTAFHYSDTKRHSSENIFLVSSLKNKQTTTTIIFSCKGLALDFEDGNFLKLAEDGTVLR